MATFTVESGAIAPANYDPLVVDFQLSSNVTNEDYDLGITDGEASGNNNLNFSYPPGISIFQPAIWNRVGFNPDQFRINSVSLLLGTGASGTAFLSEEDGTTIPTLPVTIPTNFGSPTIQYRLGVRNFTNGSGAQSSVNMNVDFIDTTSSTTINRNVRINFIDPAGSSSQATVQDDGTTDDGCIGTKTVTVIVPNGTTKFVEATSSTGAGNINGSPSISETITTDTVYNMNIIGDDATTPITTTINLTVRDTNSSGPVEDTESYTRQHSGNIC